MSQVNVVHVLIAGTDGLQELVALLSGAACDEVWQQIRASLHKKLKTFIRHTRATVEVDCFDVSVPVLCDHPAEFVALAIADYVVGVKGGTMCNQRGQAGVRYRETSFQVYFLSQKKGMEWESCFFYYFFDVCVWLNGWLDG